MLRKSVRSFVEREVVPQVAAWEEAGDLFTELFSDRPGGFGNTDVYVSRRHDKGDDFGWQAPENLGGNVNTADGELLSVFLEDVLYFNSARPGGLGGADIYASTLQPDGTFGPAIWLEELSSPVGDAPCAIRRDGLPSLPELTRQAYGRNLRSTLRA